MYRSQVPGVRWRKSYAVSHQVMTVTDLKRLLLRQFGRISDSFVFITH